MPNENSIKYLLDSNSLSLADCWEISNAILEWLENKLVIQKAPHIFFTEIICYDAIEKKVFLSDGNSSLTKNDLPHEYLSPEETGRIENEVDYRANFYRLGIIWYELFSGKPPFYNEDHYKIIWQHLAQAPPPLNNASMPISATAIIKKLLSKKSDARYYSIEGLRNDWHIAYQHFLNPHIVKDSFILGLYDFEEVFTLPATLRKWENEHAIIERICESVSNNGSKALVHIYGESLVGKTSFIQHVSQYFISKGYPIFHGTCLIKESFPFEPIKNALNEYANRLLFSESEKQLEKLKETFNIQLGDNLSVLTTFASKWEDVLNLKSSTPAEIGFESLNRLAFVIAKTLSIISKPENPVLFILEDLQNISHQTLRLFNAIIAEPELNYCVTIISNGGENLFEDTHSLSNDIIQTDTFGFIEKLIFFPLTKNEVEEILLQEKFDKIIAIQLAEIIIQKTKGIPLFIRRLIQTASENNLIKLHETKRFWQVDFIGVEKISIADNTFETLKKKYQSFDSLTQDWLQVAACIGMQFDAPTVSAVLHPIDDYLASQIIKTLQYAEIIQQEIFINNQFKFSNTDFQKFIKNQIDDKRKIDINKKLISLKLSDQNYNLNDNNLFFLIGIILELTDEDRVSYHYLLLEAAEKSKKIGAFENAAKYYRSIIKSANAISEIDSFELYAQLLEMLVANLQFEDYQKQLDEIYQKFTITNLIQSRLDLIECKSLILQQRLPEAVAYTKICLKRVGIEIDLNPSLPKIIYAMIKAQVSMKGKTISELENLPLTNDPKTKYVLQLLQETSSAFFLAAPTVLPEILALQINIAVKKGISETIGLVFAAYGLNISSFAGQFNKAEEMMLLARTLDLRFGNIKGAVVVRFLHAALTRHWHFPIRENAVLLRENYQSGRESGLIQMAYFSLATGDMFELVSGKPINTLFPQFELDYKSCIEKHQNSMAIFLSMALQFCDDLLRKERPNKILDGKYFSLENQKMTFIESNLQTHLAILFCLESQLHLIWRIYSLAKQRLKHINALQKEVGLSSLMLLLATIQTTILAYKNPGVPNFLMRSNRRKIKIWAKQSPYNFLGWHHFLEAIISIRKSNLKEAFFYLEQTIEWAEKQGIFHLKALALEEKGILLIKLGTGKRIPLALIQTYNCYQNWGAIAKCADLENKYSQIRQISLLEKTLDKNLDFTSLLKANNSIASEIKWENLLETLITILIENAGAQNAVIIIPEQSWFKEVARKNENSEVNIQSRIVNKFTLPTSLILAVQRSRKSIIINKPLQDPRWSLDQYFIKNKPLSVLCIPIVKNRDIKAIIYMENTLTDGAFTPEAVELITLLSGQIAISIVIEKLESEIVNEVNKAKHEIQQFTLNNISQELHDNVGQLLSLTKMQLNRMELAENYNKEIIREVSSNVSKVMSELRDLAKGMSSERISLIGLYESVLEEVERINKSGVICVNMSFSGIKKESDMRNQLVVFRVIQESFQNIIKHAEANNVEIKFIYDTNQTIISIKDDGKGFEFDNMMPTHAGLGLMNIFNRIKMIGGEVNLTSNLGSGTEIRIILTNLEELTV